MFWRFLNARQRNWNGKLHSCGLQQKTWKEDPSSNYRWLTTV
ncbi:hypothetical protein [Methylibium rhizosphaerae]|nr:hypothetical protein [Methylibium rhizosphaerae]